MADKVIMPQLGESIAEGFVKAGAKVYICSRKPETCAATAERLRPLGGLDR